MFNINGLEDAVKLQLLVVHVAAELVVLHSAIAVGVANVAELPGVLVLRRNLQRRQTGLYLSDVQVTVVGGVEEIEEAPNTKLPLLLRLAQGHEEVIHRNDTVSAHTTIRIPDLSPTAREKVVKVGWTETVEIDKAPTNCHVFYSTSLVQIFYCKKFYPIIIWLLAFNTRIQNQRMKGEFIGYSSPTFSRAKLYKEIIFSA